MSLNVRNYIWLASSVLALTSSVSAQPALDSNGNNGSASPETVVGQSDMAAQPPSSPLISDVAKLRQAGVSDDVIVDYINNSRVAVQPTQTDLNYLRGLGASAPVVNALVQHGEPTPLVPGQPVTITGNGAQTDAGSSVAAPQVETDANGVTTITPAAPSTYLDPAASQVADASTAAGFYSDLAPYGNWMNVPNYGECWQPSVAATEPGWTPYCDGGNWLNTDAGWYWASQYPWGGIGFHYGRWFQDPTLGWIWWPDRAWAPAWVAWRSGGQFAGWAPLPPAATFVDGGMRYHGSRVGFGFDFGLPASVYTFVDLRHFADDHPLGHFVRGRDATPIYRATQPQTVYLANRNQGVINEGPGRERIAAASRLPLRTAAIREAPTGRPLPNRFDRPERAGNQWVVYRQTPMRLQRQSTSVVSPVHVGPGASGGNRSIAGTPSVRSAASNRAYRGGLIVAGQTPVVSSGGRVLGTLPPRPAGVLPASTPPPSRPVVPNVPQQQPNTRGAIQPQPSSANVIQRQMTPTPPPPVTGGASARDRQVMQTPVPAPSTVVPRVGSFPSRPALLVPRPYSFSPSFQPIQPSSILRVPSFGAQRPSAPAPASRQPMTIRPGSTTNMRGAPGR